MIIGKKLPRVDAGDKVTGRARYTDDICDAGALIAKICHATIGNGRVTAIDTTQAQKIPGVVKIVTCFDLKEKHYFPTAGHPWSTDPNHQDVADRLVLTDRVCYYGDDVAAVIAEDEVAATQAVNALKVTYEEYPVVMDVQEAMAPDAPQIHDNYPGNILAHTNREIGDYDAATKEPGLTVVEGWYDTPTVQHCHIEPPVCYAYEEGDRITVVSSTQIPHIVRRVVGQALGVPWGKIRIVKPYIGGGFGNKQDALYEPLCAFLTTQVGGRLVKLESTREETFANTRVRHSLRFHIISHVRPDGTFAARKCEIFSNQGAYASHGHSIAAKAMGAFPQLYPCDNLQCDAYTVFTNRTVAGAMRGYGMPQYAFAVESHTEDVAAAMGMDPIAFRRKNLMPVGYTDGFSKNKLYTDSFNECINLGMETIHYNEKLAEYADQTGDVRRGIGMSVFWYNTGVWPISLESSSCRMVLNQDGSVQVQLAETEIGQGADTTFAQMTAETLGVPFDMVHMISTQDTDITPFGTGAYASRQTYAGGFAVRQTALAMKERILENAQRLTRMPAFNLDLLDGNIIRKPDGEVLMTLGELSTEVLYSLEHSEHITSESTYQIKSNAYSFGCSFAEVEVDTNLCKIKLLNLVNVHDCGSLINPALAEAQVHGGMSMGIGYALSETMLYNEKSGKLLNGNFLDYKLSTFVDHPTLVAKFVENPEPTSAFGTKSLGEPPVCPVASAIRNAVRQATGVGINQIPLRPQTLFEAFDTAGFYNHEVN